MYDDLKNNLKNYCFKNTPDTFAQNKCFYKKNYKNTTPSEHAQNNKIFEKSHTFCVFLYSSEHRYLNIFVFIFNIFHTKHQ